jgi:hypothetical protein
MRPWIVLVVGMLALSNANGQGNRDPSDPGLSVTVGPTSIPVNGTGTISGIGYPQPGLQLVVTIVSPANVTASYNLVPNFEGRYQTVFSKTPVAGDFKITVQPGGKGAGAKATRSSNSSTRSATVRRRTWFRWRSGSLQRCNLLQRIIQ